MFKLFKPSHKYWVTPGGQYWEIYKDMAEEHNLLIAGEVGSGKSCLMHGIVHTLLHNSPSKVEFIFLDPKWSEFGCYERLPHTIKYACSNDEIMEALRQAQGIIVRRKAELRASGKRQHDGPAIYIMVDEMAHVMLTMKKTARPLFQEIMQIGRALNVHVIAGTQCPLATVIPTEIRVNFTGIVGLRTATKQHSRNIIECDGCERLPVPKQSGIAYGYYKSGATCQLWKLPYVTDQEIDKICAWWTSGDCVA